MPLCSIKQDNEVTYQTLQLGALNQKPKRTTGRTVIRKWKRESDNSWQWRLGDGQQEWWLWWFLSCLERQMRCVQGEGNSAEPRT